MENYTHDGEQIFDARSLAEALLESLVENSKQSVVIISKLDTIDIKVSNLDRVNHRRISQVEERLAYVETFLGIRQGD